MPPQGEVMSSNGSIWAPNALADDERESRIRLALLRSVLDNMQLNRRMMPLFALAVAATFSYWVSWPMLAAWYAHVILGLVPHYLLMRRFPQGDMPLARTRRLALLASAANLFFVANWTSLAWYLWVPGSEANHMLVIIVLAVTLAAQATLVGACRQMALPAFLLYGVVMAIVPMRDGGAGALYLVAVTPFYAWYLAHVAKQNFIRAHAAATLMEERNSLLAELVMAKLESDRGREQAEAASLAKSQFLANMSHELRTPLNAILGFSEMISSRIFKDQPERNSEYADLIHSSGKHLLALINDILDLAKIEAGRWKLEEAELDLHRIADDALQFVVWRSKENNATIQNAIAPDLERVYGDERAIKQILLNLLSNALKFTPEHGRVTAFAHRDAEGGMVLGVSDTGVGIAPEDQDRVFDSFGQGKHDVALVDRGTGLGLAIVKGLTESHGGHVRLKSEVGKGTTVTIHLPAARVLARPNQASPDQASDDLAHFVA